MKTKRLVIDAMMCALYVVLSNYLALPLGPMKLTLDGLPIILTGLLFGPLDGLLVGFIGNILSQVLGPYGLSATTLLWALPDAVRGLLIGLYRRHWYTRPCKAVMMGVFVAAALTVTGLTTFVMYIDCLVFQYSFASYTPYILWRVLSGVIMAAIFTMLVPLLLPPLQHILRSVSEGK